MNGVGEGGTWLPERRLRLGANVPAGAPGKKPLAGAGVAELAQEASPAPGIFLTVSLFHAQALSLLAPSEAPPT